VGGEREGSRKADKVDGWDGGRWINRQE